MSVVALDLLRPSARLNIENLCAESADNLIGYKVVAGRLGPNVVVAGFNPIASRVYERLLKMPALASMRGTLSLIYVDALDAAGGVNFVEHRPEYTVDRILVLPFPPTDKSAAWGEQEAFGMVTRLCEKLGMIYGCDAATAEVAS